MMDYVLSKDGEVVFRGTESECYAELHKKSPHSWHHSTTHEGWKIAKHSEQEKPETPTCIHCSHPADGVDGKCGYHSVEDLNMSMLDSIIEQHRQLAKGEQTEKAPVDVFDLGQEG